MLMPKRTKFRKQQRGKRRGKATRGAELNFGDYGLQATECGWLTTREIEAARIAITRFIKRGRILYEMEGVTKDVAKEAFRLASHKLSIPTRIAYREGHI